MPKARKVRIGVVISDRMNKTRVVEITKLKRHSLYGKVMRSTKRYYAHDERDLSHLGDRIEIEETRPISKLKHWRVIRRLGGSAG